MAKNDFDNNHENVPEGDQDANSRDDLINGNPNLIYESKFVEGWEPSGVAVCIAIVEWFAANWFQDAVEITRCVGVENWLVHPVSDHPGV